MAKRRRGRPLPPVPTADLIAASAELARLDRLMVAAGYRRAATARPYLAASADAVTLRVVWRRRAAGLTAVFFQVVRLPAGWG